MKIEEVICDQCGARKGKANHWYRVVSGRQGFHLYKSEAELADDEYEDYCSDNCVTRALQQFLDPPMKATNFDVDTEEMMTQIESDIPF